MKTEAIIGSLIRIGVICIVISLYGIAKNVRTLTVQQSLTTTEQSIMQNQLNALKEHESLLYQECKNLDYETSIMMDEIRNK